MKKRWRLFLAATAVTLGLLSASARAVDVSPEEFRRRGEALLLAGQARGLTELSGIPIGQLLQEIRALPVDILPRGLSASVDNRNSAMWWTMPGGHVTLNSSVSNVPEDALAVLAVHETMGFYHKADLNYESSLMRLWAKTQGWTLPETTNADWDRQARDNADKLRSGGSTVVGGGGDGDDILFRMQALKSLGERAARGLESPGGFPLALVQRALTRMKISPASDVTQPLEIWELPNDVPTVYVLSELYRSKEEKNRDRQGVIAVALAEAFLAAHPDVVGLVKIQTTPSTYGDKDLLDAMSAEWRNLAVNPRSAADLSAWSLALQDFAQTRILFSNQMPQLFTVSRLRNAIVIDVDQKRWTALSKTERSRQMRALVKQVYFFPAPAMNDWDRFKYSFVLLGNPYTREITERLAAAIAANVNGRADLIPALYRVSCALGQNWEIFAAIQGSPTPVWFKNDILRCHGGVGLDQSRWKNMTPQQKSQLLWDRLFP